MINGLLPEDCEIILVCNGCTDDTADKARAYLQDYANLKVIETDVASKVHALNLGDEHAKGFPRAYIDADIALDGKALSETIRIMDHNSSILVAAPKLNVDTSRSNFGVRAFYTIWMQLPYFSKGQMVGSGVFILSKKGRSHFQRFPEIISDDGYVRSLFSESERQMIKEAAFTIFAPKTLKNLIKIKTRVRFGNMEVAQKYPSMSIGKDNGMSDIIKLTLKKPWLCIHSLLYIYVQLQTKRLSKARMAAADFTTWERDDSSRI